MLSASSLYLVGTLLRIRDKWSASIKESSKAKKDTIQAVPGKKVYKDCCRKYRNTHQMANDTN